MSAEPLAPGPVTALGANPADEPVEVRPAFMVRIDLPRSRPKHRVERASFLDPSDPLTEIPIARGPPDERMTRADRLMTSVRAVARGDVPKRPDRLEGEGVEPVPAPPLREPVRQFTDCTSSPVSRPPTIPRGTPGQTPASQGWAGVCRRPGLYPGQRPSLRSPGVPGAGNRRSPDRTPVEAYQGRGPITGNAAATRAGSLPAPGPSVPALERGMKLTVPIMLAPRIGCQVPKYRAL